MVDIRISEQPPADFSSEASAIRSAATAVGLAIPLAELANWCLAGKASVIFSGGWPSTVSALSSRIYHKPTVNCERIVIIAVIEKANQAGGRITITPDDGGGPAVSYDLDDDDARSQFSVPIWHKWVATADLVDQSEQYHSVVWTDLIVRSLTILEMPRDLLDPSSDTAVSFRDGPNSGLFAGRMITDDTDASIIDILTAIGSAKTNTRRHGGGIMLPDSSPWSLVSNGAWGDIADSYLGTSGFGFQHKARQVDSATVTVKYTGRVRAKYKGTGTGDLVISGEKATLSFIGSLSDVWEWHTGTFKIDAGATDTLKPLVKTSDGTTAVAMTDFDYYEAT